MTWAITSGSPLTPRGGKTGTLTTGETIITIPTNTYAIELYGDTTIRVRIDDVGTAVAVADAAYGYQHGGVVRRYYVNAPGSKHRYLHLAADSGSTCYEVSFLH